MAVGNKTDAYIHRMINQVKLKRAANAVKQFQIQSTVPKLQQTLDGREWGVHQTLDEVDTSAAKNAKKAARRVSNTTQLRLSSSNIGRKSNAGASNGAAAAGPASPKPTASPKVSTTPIQEFTG